MAFGVGGSQTMSVFSTVDKGNQTPEFRSKHAWCIQPLYNLVIKNLLTNMMAVSIVMLHFPAPRLVIMSCSVWFKQKSSCVCEN